MKNNNQKTEMLKPLIFNKKINLKHKIIPLDVISNTIGPTRVFPTATKEWFNSVYAYNQNFIKNLSIADKTLSQLVKSYFNLYFNKKVLKSSKIALRFRRLSLNKILISKAELKHTSSKVTVTLYTYNAEKIFLTLKLKNLIKAYFTSKLKNLDVDPSLINLLHDINVYKKGISLVDYLEELKSNLKSNLDLKVDPYMESYLDILDEMIILSKNDKTANKKLDQIYTESLRKNFLSKEIKEIATYKLLLNLNKSKFEDEFIIKLKGIIGKLYNKEVEFNIVNLKTLYFNSDIFTEVISTKLKNRKNNLLNVLKSSLYLVKLPRVNKIKENSVKVDKFCLDHLKNLHINSSINKYNTDKDTLDQLLLDILPSSTFMLGDNDKTALTAFNENYTNTYNPLDIVIDSLKNKDMAGVRLEAKGRLSKRSAASRSVFKVKWKGSIKNLDSSYKKLSSVMLRGHAKSNVQYTVINSKTRSGAFGLKGWISSK
uniref:Small ribosomal subunit protein uS3m n=1 Tax=Pseudogymnoascus pannorum TaxID=79858 RepID=A0A0U2DB59_9PEZI|nr:ribosomal protein S3 [Pseudogymnoascus pannorum]AKM70290.1 ribosomal protein S3 [Pseudogymnoascus pannorum]